MSDTDALLDFTKQYEYDKLSNDEKVDTVFDYIKDIGFIDIYKYESEYQYL